MKLDAFNYLMNKNKGGSSGGAELNIAYGDTAPDDTSKLWVKTAEPEGVQITPKLHPMSEVLIMGIKQITDYAYDIASAVVGTKMYLFGGKYATNLKKINVFDTESNTITALGTTLPSAAYGIASAVVGTKVYLFGGRMTNSYLKTINVFDTESNTITTLSTTLPYAAHGIAPAVIGTKVYLFGGYTDSNYNYTGGGDYLKTINVFDTESNTITTLSTTLPAYTYGIAPAVIGTKVYLFGGYTGNPLHTINVFDTESNTITTLSTTLPYAAHDIASAVVGTKVYLFGGYSGSDYHNTINVFDTESNAITTLDTKLPNPAYGIASSVVGTKVYLYGGITEGRYLDTINVFVALAELSENNMLIETSTAENTIDLLPNIKVGVRNVFIGNAEGYAERAEAYLHNGTEWRKL